MAEYTQAGKPMRINTSAGPDALLLERLECDEAVSSPYEISLELLSTDTGINLPKLLRTPVTITVELENGGSRYFHGLIRRFVQAGRSDSFVSYRAEVVPSLWFLSLATDCRIFQQKTVPDIIKEVLKDGGVTDVRSQLTATYSAREYCVQYRESQLAFISRLMEEEGIYYFFEHEKDKHVMVLADAPSAIKPGAVPKLRMRSVAAATVASDMISELTIETAVRSVGTITLMDYNETTAKKLEAAATSRNIATATQLKQYDYPGKFAVKDDGERIARVRIEEAESLAYVVQGRTASRSIRSGQKLDISDHYRADINVSYHVLTARHSATEGSYRSGPDAEPFSFETSFESIPHSIPFRPAPTTPRPVVHGSQTAVVVGKSGEEIYVDKYGRVKVQFFWDHVGKNDENSSCWVRVSSNWAGKQWGFIQLPRIGQEVIVDFLEGDPDRPLIIGRVYNGDQMPPYALPANMTQSGVKTRSSKGGGASDANEIRFEDKKGSEILEVHAQKDFIFEAENDETDTIGNNRTTSVKVDDTLTVDGKQAITVKGDQSLTVKDGKHAVTVQTGDQTVTVEKGNQVLEVSKGNHTLKVKMGNSTTEVAQGDLSIKLNMGNIAMKADLGGVKQEAMQSLELKVGQSSIKLDQTGVTIKGLKVAIEGTTMTDIKGLMTTVKADAVMTVKGSVTMIN